MALGRFVAVGEVLILNLGLQFMHQPFYLFHVIHGRTYLVALQDLRIEVVGLVHVQVVDDGLICFSFQHPFINRDVMKELFVGVVLEVVHYRDDRRLVL